MRTLSDFRVFSLSYSEPGEVAGFATSRVSGRAYWFWIREGDMQTQPLPSEWIQVEKLVQAGIVLGPTAIKPTCMLLEQLMTAEKYGHWPLLPLMEQTALTANADAILLSAWTNTRRDLLSEVADWVRAVGGAPAESLAILISSSRSLQEAHRRAKASTPAEFSKDLDFEEYRRKFFGQTRPSRKRDLATMIGLGSAALFIPLCIMLLVLLMKSTEYRVPDFRGALISDVRSAIDESDWQLDIRYREGGQPDQVVAQSPNPGEELRRREKIKLVVNTGVRLVKVPRTRGLLYEEAVWDLEERGLHPVKKATLEGTEVISSQPAAGEEVQTGSSVTLITKPRRNKAAR